jgi:hypothetical protein
MKIAIDIKEDDREALVLAISGAVNDLAHEILNIPQRQFRITPVHKLKALGELEFQLFLANVMPVKGGEQSTSES